MGEASRSAAAGLLSWGKHERAWPLNDTGITAIRRCHSNVQAYVRECLFYAPVRQHEVTLCEHDAEAIGLHVFR